MPGDDQRTHEKQAVTRRGEPLTTPRPGKRAEPSLLYICGSGRSGSTLLDMLLGGHSAISALGEAGHLYLSARGATEVDLCTCGSHVLECPFWVAVDRELRRLRPDLAGPALSQLPTLDPQLIKLRKPDGLWIRPTSEIVHRSRLREALLALGSRSLFRLVSFASPEVRRHYEIACNRQLIYEAVRKVHGTPVVLDSTKTAGDMKAIYMTSSVPMHVIFLKRDGRAVACARMRREGCSMREAAAIWAAEQRNQRLVRFSIPSSAIKSLKYEDLCRDPVEELTSLCDALGISYEPQMLEFRGERHNVGGNPMRLRSGETRIKLDERWRDELSAADKETFEQIAGKMNRSLGYT